MSRAVGNAVMRNRVKRRLRALVSGGLPALPAGVDLVVRANAAAGTATFDDLRAALDRCLPRALTKECGASAHAGVPTGTGAGGRG